MTDDKSSRIRIRTLMPDTGHFQQEAAKSGELRRHEDSIFFWSLPSAVVPIRLGMHNGAETTPAMPGQNRMRGMTGVERRLGILRA
jgi:hypothetical protein